MIAPNFRGSTGFGLAHMDAVFGDGCGVADLADCEAAARHLLATCGAELDASRGCAIAGHSWGGFVVLRALTSSLPASALNGLEGGPPLFSCGIASAAISDWFAQQRHTEVRPSCLLLAAVTLVRWWCVW